MHTKVIGQSDLSINFLKGDTREASDLIVIDDEAHWNSFDEQIELHLFYNVTLHVGLHCRPHDVMCWVHHHKPR